MKVGVIAKKKVSTWTQPNLKFKDFFKALGKGGIDAATGQWLAVGKDGIDALSALGKSEHTPEHLAWALIYNSLTQAIENLVTDSHPLFRDVPESFDQLTNELDLSFDNNELEITTNFLDYPKQLSIIQDIQIPFRQWLGWFGVESSQASAISKRLPTYFVFALHEEWRHHPEYSQLTKQIQTPFTKAGEREHDWMLYSSWLQKQTEEPMMLEAFGLQDVYIPLRGYYRRKCQEQNTARKDSKRSSHLTAVGEFERVVVDLESNLQEWMMKADRHDSIRIISGGPGSGKSTFAKIFAAHHALNFDFPVLFIPLHFFDPSGDLVNSVGNFIRFDEYLRQNPIDPKNEQLRLLIIFDGLDELAMLGKLSKEVAQNFISEIQSKISQFNIRKTRLQVIITGREVVVQESFRDPQQVLHVLPYFIPKNKRDEEDGEQYIDPEKQLARDQRDDWWQQYGSAMHKSYEGLPEDLNQGDLTEITAQPLLNYLVALSYLQGKLSISDKTNLNTVYSDLLDAVFERGYEQRGKQSKHLSIRDLSKDHFILILEEIALAAWHGNGRTTTVSEIERHCKRSGLDRLLAIFEEGAEVGVTRLLAAFYFRRCGEQSNERTFEFTHKSFGEYLTARRIVRAMRRIQQELELREKEIVRGWDERDALLCWVEVCGPTRIDTYLLSFLQRELALQDMQGITDWQTIFVKLIGFMLRNGMPMEKIEPSLTFFHSNLWAIHAEEALLAVLSASSVLTKKLSKVEWKRRELAGTWLRRLQGQRSNENECIALFCLNDLDLSRCILSRFDFQKANLAGANLAGANLSWAHLLGAHLSGAHLLGAHLSGAHLLGANLERANLERANLERANLSGAHLLGRIFQGRILQGRILKGRIWKGRIF